MVAEATGIIFQPFEEVRSCSGLHAQHACMQLPHCTINDTGHNACWLCCCPVQVKGELQRIEQLLDSNNGTSQSLARFNYATDLEAAINEQIK